MRLWGKIPFGAKLIGAFLIIVLLASAISYSLADRAIIQVFEEFSARSNARIAHVLSGALGEYYTRQGGWDKLNLHWLILMSRRMGRPFLLADRSGRVRFSSVAKLKDRQLSPEELARGTQIKVEDRSVGVLLIGPFQPGGSPLEQGFMSSINRAILLAGGLTALLALLLGAGLVRQVTWPLRALARASERIAGGKLDQRVELRREDELGQLGRSFNRMAANLERSERARRQMLADVSHELRTPLMIVQGGLEAFIDGVLAPSNENLSALHAKTLLLSRLVRDLRELALAEAGELSLERAPLDPAQLLSQAGLAIKSRLTEKGITLELELPARLPKLEADAQRLEQVLLNLLSNAARATPAGGRICLSAQVRQDEVQFSVSDSGPGIAAEELPHIFERFYRGDKSRARSSGGAGLGLAIAQALVLAHGGRIWAESRPGEGATFSFTLPS